MESEVLRRYAVILMELERLRSIGGDMPLDDLDREQYAAALRGLNTTEQLDAVRREIRRRYRFCPTALDVENLANEIAPKPQLVPAYHLPIKIPSYHEAAKPQGDK